MPRRSRITEGSGLPETANAESAIELAEHEAAEALSLLAAVENQALSLDPHQRPSAAKITEARHLAEFAKRRIAVAQERAEKARAAQRLAGLTDVGRDVDELARAAAGPAGEHLAALLSQLADAAEAVRAHCREHDA